MTVLRVWPRRGYRWYALGAARVPGAPTNAALLRSYAASLIATSVSSTIAWILAPWMALDSLVMIYLVGVVAVAARYGRGPSTLAAVASAVAFDFFFTLPLFSLRIADPRLVITVGVMLLVGLVVSELTTALRERGFAAVAHARRVAVLYSLARDLSRATDDTHIYRAARRHIARAVGGGVIFFEAADVDAQTLVEVDGRHPDSYPASLEVAEWAFHHRRRAGRSTTHHPNAEDIYLPLVAAERAIGVMVVSPRSREARLAAAQTRFLGHCARQVAAAMERERLVRATHALARAAEEQQLRNTLLTSVSHDLRRPLMAIEAAAASLLDGSEIPQGDAYSRRVRVLVAEASHMSDSVNKILDMTRLESAGVQLDRRWYPVEPLVVGALQRIRGCLAEHVVVPALPADLLWVYVDALMFEKLLTNLLENAAKYSPAGSRIGIAAVSRGNATEIRVTDEGCGLPEGDADAVFRKFHRGEHRSDVPGIGLGLSICRAIVTLHGGSITARRLPTAGTEVVVSLPALSGAPAMAADVEVTGEDC